MSHGIMGSREKRDRDDEPEEPRRTALNVEWLALALRIVEATRPAGAYPHIGPDPDAVARAIEREYAALAAPR